MSRSEKDSALMHKAPYMDFIILRPNVEFALVLRLLIEMCFAPSSLN